MIVYCLLLCVIALFAYLKKNHYKVNDIFICVFLIFISGFRFMVGIDYENYMNGYNSPDKILYEPIWYVVTYFLNYFGFSHQSFFLLTSFIIVSCTFYAARKFDISITIFVMFMFVITNLYIESMNLVRQYVAISIAFLAFIYRSRGDIFRYAFLIILAFLCHTTALICIPIFELVRFRYNITILLLLIVVSLVLGESISSYFINFISSHTDSSFVYSSYLTNKTYLVISTGTYKYLLNIIALYYILRQNKILGSNVYPILNLFVISVCMYNIFLYFDVGIRLSKYFFYFIILLIPHSLKKCGHVYDYLIIVILSIGLLLFTLKDVYTDAYTPFRFNFKLISL